MHPEPNVGKSLSYKLVAEVGLGIFSFFYALGIYVPWNILTFEAGFIDNSWEFILHYAFDKNWQFGKDIIFTFGPFGFLYGGNFFPSTYSLLIGFWIWFASLSVWFWIRLWWCYSVPFWVRIPLIILVPGIAMNGAINAVTSIHRTDAFFYSLGFYCLFHYFFLDQKISETEKVIAAKFQAFQDRHTGFTYLIIFVHFIKKYFGSFTTLCFISTLGFCALIKFTFLAQSVLCIGLISLDQGCRQRKIPTAGLLFGAVFLTGWGLAGQQISNLIPYFRYSVEIARYHTEAMHVESHHFLAALFAVGVLSLVTSVGITQWKQNRGWGVLFTIGLSGCLWLSLKSGFVRYHPSHMGPSVGFLLLVVIVIAMSLAQVTTTRPQRLLLAISIGCTVWTFWYSLIELRQGPLQFLLTTVSTGYQGFTKLIHFRSGREALAQAFQQRLDTMKAKYPFPQTQGTVDVYPFAFEISMIACGLDYRPRPIFQSYLAYSPTLAEINAQRLRGPTSPDVVMLFIGAIDGRSPFMEDSLSWPELLTRYDLASIRNPVCFTLKKRSVPRSFQKTPQGSFAVGLGEDVSIPPEWQVPQELLWVEVDLNPSLPGSIRSMLYQPPTVLLKVETQDKKIRMLRLLPSLARTGFFLAPQPHPPTLFHPKTFNADPAHRVSRISVVCEDGQAWCFQPTVSFTLSRFQISDE